MLRLRRIYTSSNTYEICVGLIVVLNSLYKYRVHSDMTDVEISKITKQRSPCTGPRSRDNIRAGFASGDKRK